MPAKPVSATSSRTSKNDLRLEAYADVDEANSQLGVAIALGGLEADVCEVDRGSVQNDLFDVGADLCTPVVEDPAHPPLRDRAAGRRPARGMVRPLQPVAALTLRSFILPPVGPKARRWCT